MKKYFTKKTFALVAIFGLGLGFANTSTTAYASNSTTGFTLTIQQAANRAAQTSRQIRTTQEDIYLAETNIDFMRNNLPSPADSLTSFINAQSNLMIANANRAAQLSSIDAMRDTFGFLAATHFTNIMAAEGELALFEDRLALQQQELTILRAMVSVGHASEIEYQLATIALETAIHNNQLLKNALDEAHVNLNRLMGTPTNRMHNLVWDKEFEEMHVINFTGHLNQHRQNHASIVQARAIADAAFFRVDNYRTEIDPQTGEQLFANPVTGQPFPTRDELALQARQASRNVVTARNAVEEHITETYHAIRTLERQIASERIALEDLHQQGAILAVRLQIGEVAPIELVRHEVAVLEQQEVIRRLELNHNLLEMQFRNPNIAF